MEKTVSKSGTMRGPADVRVTRDSVQVVMLEDDKTKKYKKGQMFEFAKADTPRVVYPGKGFWVNMNKQGSKLYSQSPLRSPGERLHFVSVAGKPGAEPKPRYDAGGRSITLASGQSFITQPSFSLDLVYEIVGGKYDGLTVVALLPYIFAPASDGGTKLDGRDKEIERVSEWMDAHGIEKNIERLPFDDNLAPAIVAILKKNPDVEGEIENGLALRFAPAEKAAKKTTAKARR